ncbi:MAG: fumarylacetoacetate hydrolase family protein [Deltaproteobacteria bacterium]|nr:fumarylacetoacetate hydrolase family protein [Deltaproteobacteria bacterium]
MKTALVNLHGRAALRRGDGAVDLEKASRGALPSDPMAAIRAWDVVRDWAAASLAGASEGLVTTLDEAALGPPVPFPAQVFALGLNYRDHAAEAGLELPKSPMIFTKFPSCLAGPRAAVPIGSSRVDWEVELVAVIGRGGRNIPEAKALEHVAGYCVGQDVSDRRLQFSDTPAQFSLGKSLANFGPIGPAVISLDAIPDPNDLALTCDVSGERMQSARTSLMVFSVPETIAYLSRHCTLLPGDLIFTGTPAGVGSVRNPRRYLAVGDEITSEIEHLGTLVNRCVAPAAE